VSGASIETTLELWASALRDVKARMRQLFKQERMAVSAGLLLDGLLGEERRKTGWMRAEAAGDRGPWRQQSVLGRGQWDADALRDIVRQYAVETLADAEAVLVIDETGFLKQGKASCGVARQYTGSAGKITNCQIGVFAAYVSRHGHALIDRCLYLPKAWTEDPARLATAHVPEDVGFATKPGIALGMIKRALAANVPFAWLAADTVYGVGEVEQVLRRAGKGYVLGVPSTHQVRSWGKALAVTGTAEAVAASRTAQDWQAPVGRHRDQGAALARVVLRGTRRPLGRRVWRQRTRGLDTGLADSPSPRRRRIGVLLDLVSGRHAHRNAGRRRGPPLVHRGQLRDGQERAWTGS